MKIVFLLILCWSYIISLPAQTNETAITGKNIGRQLTVGHISLYDQYLSLLPYEGASIGFARDRIKQLSQSPALSLQGMLKIDLASPHNPSDNGRLLYGMIRYYEGVYYEWKPVNRFKLYGGALMGGHLGGIYNPRNSNNPAQAKFNLGLALSGKGCYKMVIRNFPIYLQAQSIWHIAGCSFSPHFGQSYYEIFSLKHLDGVFLFSSLHNTLEITNRLNLDLPLKRCTLRIGYDHYFLKTDYHSLHSQINNHAFLIGFTKESLRFHFRKKGKPANYQSPIYD